MANFQNILVGVDLSRGDWLASAAGETPSHFACEQAVTLAVASNAAGQPAKIHFLAALDLDVRTQTLLEQESDDENTVVDQAEVALKHQVAAAAEQGVTATYEVVLGSSRVELVREANQGNHHLVLIGCRGHGLLSGVLMGSTAIELLSKSTRPVWVVKPHTPDAPNRILVGTDFSPVCTALFNRAVELAQLIDAELHVTHVVEEARRPFLQFSQVAEDAIKQAHDEAVAKARAQLDALAKRPDVVALAKPLVVHISEGIASTEVIKQTKELDIDLLLFGTVAWSGVPGLVIGSTAHKMLPDLDCSLLTMRPDDVG